MKSLLRLAVAVALGVMGLATPAMALNISVTNVTQPFFETVHVAGFTTAGPFAHVFAASDERSGQIVLTTNIGNLGTWCVDLFHTISLGGSYTLTETSLATDNSGTGPANSNPLSSTQIARIESLAAYGSSQPQTNHFSAVVQAAIWIAEYGLNPVTGVTNVSDSTFASDLATLLAMSLPAGDGLQVGNVDGNGVFTVQNLEVPVPEPGTLALVGSLLVALGLLRGRLRGSRTSSI